MAAWTLALEIDGSTQYLGDVRRFMASTADYRSSTEEDLTRYVLGLPGAATRRRAVSALRSFYRFLHEDRRADHNPASHLSRRVKRADDERSLLHEVIRCCGHEQAAALTWRDIVMIMVGHQQPDCLLQLRPRELAALLSQAKERIAKSALPRIADNCAQRVFANGNSVAKD